MNVPWIVTSSSGISKSVLFHPLKSYPGAVAAGATVTCAPYLYVAASGNVVAPSGTGLFVYSYVTV